MKDKKVVIIFSVIAIIIIAIIGLSYLYLETDMFKTEQQLFYKYLAQTEIMNSDFLEQSKASSERITKNSNSSTATVNISTSIPNTETGVADVQQIISVKSNGLENVLSNQSYRDFTISSGEQNILTLKYMRDNNIYAIGADNILAKYIAVENNNLKDLASKFGVEDTTNIPNSIPTDLNEILKIDETTLTQLSETYLTLIYNNIDETHFYKTINEDKTETIGVALTEQEVKTLTILVLETAKSDNTLLNLIIEKSNILGINGVTIESIQNELQEYIDDLQEEVSMTTTEDDGWKISDINEYERTTNRIIKLSLTKKEKEIIAINFATNYTKQTKIYENAMSDAFNLIEENVEDILSIDFSAENNIDVSIKENNMEIGNVNINYSYDSNNFNIITTMELKENDEIQTIKMQYQTNNIQTDNVTQNFAVEINNNNEESYQINFTNTISLKQDVIISKLTTENSAKLNDMTSEEISQLIIALSNRINQLYGTNLEV